MSDGDHYDPIRKSHEGANASVDGYALPISDTLQKKNEKSSRWLVDISIYIHMYVYIYIFYNVCIFIYVYIYIISKRLTNETIHPRLTHSGTPPSHSPVRIENHRENYPKVGHGKRMFETL